MNKNMIVLVQPEIPYNTGNVARTCVVSDSRLGLVRPLGFQLTSKLIKKAGMDYWPQVDLTTWDSLEDFEEAMVRMEEEGYRILIIESTTDRTLGQVEVDGPVLLIFGSESHGLPQDFLDRHADKVVRIPMRKTERSLNLSNAVAIALYEALRQQGYPGLH